MKLILQLVNHKTGQRSQPLELTREEIATEMLRSKFLYREEPEAVERHEKDFVLVLMEKPDGSEEEFDFSRSPLFTVKDFIDYVLTAEAQENLLASWDLLEQQLGEQHHG